MRPALRSGHGGYLVAAALLLLTAPGCVSLALWGTTRPRETGERGPDRPAEDIEAAWIRDDRLTVVVDYGEFHEWVLVELPARAAEGASDLPASAHGTIGAGAPETGLVVEVQEEGDDSPRGFERALAWRKLPDGRAQAWLRIETREVPILIPPAPGPWRKEFREGDLEARILLTPFTAALDLVLLPFQPLMLFVGGWYLIFVWGPL